MRRSSVTYLFVHDNIDLYSALCRGLEHIVNAILLVLRRRSSQIKLWRKPPFWSVMPTPVLRDGLTNRESISCPWPLLMPWRLYPRVSTTIQHIYPRVSTYQPTYIHKHQHTTWHHFPLAVARSSNICFLHILRGHLRGIRWQLDGCGYGYRQYSACT